MNEIENENCAQSADEGAKSADEFFGKPEKYDYNELQIPSGYELDNDLTDKFNDYASKMNLSQKGANELLSLALELQMRTQNDFSRAIQEVNENRAIEYQNALQNDKEIGGAKLNGVLQVANVAYNHFATDEVKNLFSQSAISAHPAIIKMFHSIGEKMKQGEIYVTSACRAETKNREDILYTTMN